MERRGFLKNSTIAAASLGFVGLQTTKGEPQMKNVFVHQVYFWLKEPVTAEVKKKFEASLKKLVKIETIQAYHLGKPAGTSRDVIDSSYHYSLLTIFKDKKGQDIYQEHPIHDEFKKNNADLWEKVIVYDSVDMS
jgi:hypothetical protein